MTAKPRLVSLRPGLATLDTRSAKPPASHAGASGFARTDGKTRQQRGYGADWDRLRLAHLATEPLCRFCAEHGRVTAATHVDHIASFHGLDDPLRLDPGNLRSACNPCHMRRTGRQAHGEDDLR